MKKSTVLWGFIIGLFLLFSGWGFVSPVQAAAPVEIKLAHGDPPDIFTSKKAAGSTVFKIMMETQGVNVNLFPAGQLGAEREIAEAVKLGTVQMGMVSAVLANYFKPVQVLDIPYLFPSAAVAWQTMDGPFGHELAAACLKETGIRILGYDQVGFRNFSNSIKPIKTPADLKGMKIRVMESPVYIAMMKALGASPTPVPWTETYTALQQKVVDGQENPVATVKFGKIYEVNKYYTLDGHAYGVSFIIINEKFFQSLSKENQQNIREAAAAAVLASRGIDTVDSATGLQFLKEKGMEIYSPTAQEKALFKQATQKPVMDYLVGQIGQTWIDRVQKAVKEAETDVAKGI